MNDREAVIDGKCVVIGLQSTGEARTADEFETRDEEEPEDFISTAKYKKYNTHIYTFVLKFTNKFTWLRFYNNVKRSYVP